MYSISSPKTQFSINRNRTNRRHISPHPPSSYHPKKSTWNRKKNFFNQFSLRFRNNFHFVYFFFVKKTSIAWQHGKRIEPRKQENLKETTKYEKERKKESWNRSQKTSFKKKKLEQISCFRELFSSFKDTYLCAKCVYASEWKLIHKDFAIDGELSFYPFQMSPFSCLFRFQDKQTRERDWKKHFPSTSRRAFQHVLFNACFLLFFARFDFIWNFNAQQSCLFKGFEINFIQYKSCW